MVTESARNFMKFHHLPVITMEKKVYVETIPSHGWFIEYYGIVSPTSLEKISAQSLMPPWYP